MNADQQSAVSICQKMIDSGSRKAEIYHKLASSLYRTEEIARARITLDKALDLYPGDKDLKLLDAVMKTDADEQSRLDEAQKKNEVIMSLAKLKLSCLTGEGLAGINACKQHLSTTNKDAGRIQTRLDELEQLAYDSAPNTNNAPETKPPSMAEKETEQAPEVIVKTTEPPPRTIASNPIVKNAQQLLNDLGFNAGVADGVTGARTRQALGEFYSLFGILKAQNNIDERTINDLMDAKSNLLQAQQLVAESRNAEKNGELKTALSKLDDAQRTSLMVEVPFGYRDRLQKSLDAQQNNQQNTQANLQPEKLPDQNGKESEQAKEEALNPVVATNPEFDDLYRQILLLKSQAFNQKQTLENQLTAIRELSLNTQ